MVDVYLVQQVGMVINVFVLETVVYRVVTKKHTLVTTVKKVGTVQNAYKHVLSTVMTRDAIENRVTVCHAFQTVLEINATALDIAMILIRTCALTLETATTAEKTTSVLTVIKCV